MTPINILILVLLLSTLLFDVFAYRRLNNNYNSLYKDFHSLNLFVRGSLTETLDNSGFVRKPHKTKGCGAWTTKQKIKDGCMTR